MPEEGWAPLAEELAADVRRVADRLRTLSAARLAGPPAPPEDGMPPYRSRAQAARGAAQAMADAAAALECCACALPTGLFSPPMARSAEAGIASRTPDRYFFGSAVNFAAQPFEQK